MNKNLETVGAYMTPAPRAIESDDNLATALHAMRRDGVRHLPVTEDGHLVGITSDRDLKMVAGLLGRVEFEDTKVRQVMIAEPYQVSPDTPLRRVAAEMAEYRVGSAIVVRGEHIVGIFTTTDALRALAELIPIPA